MSSSNLSQSSSLKQAEQDAINVAVKDAMQLYSQSQTRKQYVVFSGNSHPQLAKGICEFLGVSLGKCEVRYFGNTETRPLIDESVRNKEVYIIQTGSYDHSPQSYEKFGIYRNVNDHIQETLLLMDACKRSGCGNITLIVPCYPYARQDKKDKPR